MNRLLLAVALCSACYSPSYQDCQITCAAQTCPSGYTCESGFCVATAGTSCGPDAAVSIPWGTPTAVMFVAGTPLGMDDDLTLADDELHLYLNRSSDIWVSQRATTMAAWDSPSVAAELSSTTAIDESPELSPDGRAIVFASDRAGGAGGFDLWTATRTSITSSFNAPTTLSAAVSSASHDVSPSISRDGLALVFASDRGGNYDIYMSTRASTSVAWSAPQPITAINNQNTSAEDNPFLSADKLTIYFSSNRTGNHDLYQARRSSVGEPFGAPTPISELNTAGHETDPWVSSDGKHIYFTNTSGGSDRLLHATR